MVSVRRLALFLCALLLALAPPAFAWGPLGHRVVAALAQRQLTPTARATVARLLAGGHETTLVDVANWADELRHDPDRHDLWRATRALHYVNFPGHDCRYMPPRDCREGRCVVAAIDRYTAILADHGRPVSERRQALAFVVHFVGDVHQPLHAGKRGDLGGNKVQVRMGGKGSNLHRVWDSGLLDTRGLGWRDYAQVLADDGPVSLPLARTRPGVPQAAAWAEESCRIVRDDGVYPHGHAIDGAYVRAERPLAERRLREAGTRLARLLNRALAAG